MSHGFLDPHACRTMCYIPYTIYYIPYTLYHTLYTMCSHGLLAQDVEDETALHKACRRGDGRPEFGKPEAYALGFGYGWLSKLWPLLVWESILQGVQI